MRRRDAEAAIERAMTEYDPGVEYDITMMPDGPRGQWAAAVMQVGRSGEPDPETDQTVYVHRDGTVEGPY